MQSRIWLNGWRTRLWETWWPRWSPMIPSLLGGIATCMVLATLFVFVADEIVEDRRLRLDLQFAGWIRSHANPAVTWIMNVVTDFASSTIAVPLFVLTVALLLAHHRRRAAVLVTLTWPLGQALVALMKLDYHRARPDLGPGVVPYDGYSFPSGHTFTAVVTYGLLAALIAQRLSGRARWAPWAVATLAVVGVGYSRVYLGAHYPVDVLGSLLLGGAWLRATLLALSHGAPRRSDGPSS